MRLAVNVSLSVLMVQLATLTVFNVHPLFYTPEKDVAILLPLVVNSILFLVPMNPQGNDANPYSRLLALQQMGIVDVHSLRPNQT